MELKSTGERWKDALCFLFSNFQSSSSARESKQQMIVPIQNQLITTNGGPYHESYIQQKLLIIKKGDQ